MYKRIDFSNLGGNPIDQQSLQWMQESYRDSIAAICLLMGDKVIVQGCVISGATISDGWVIINGQLMPFRGGLLNNYIITAEALNYRPTFEDGGQKPVEYSHSAACSATAGYPLGDFLRLETLQSVAAKANNLAALTATMNSSLTNHIADLNNPHHTTKAQIGLGNLPNSISNDVNSNDGNTLATTALTKVLYDLIKNQKGIRYAGSYYMGDVGINPAGYPDSSFTIYHNLNINGSYIVVGNLRGVSDAHYYGNKLVPGWDWDNDVMFITYNLQANSFGLGVREIALQTQLLYFDYIIINL